MTVLKSIAISVYGLALILTSLGIVWKGASDEPYFAFRASDAIVQVMAGTVLAMLWLHIGYGIAAGVWRRLLSRTWLLSLLLVGVNVFALVDGALGYVVDIERFALSKNPTDRPNQALEPTTRLS